MPVERFLASLRFEQRGKLEQLGIEIGTLDRKSDNFGSPQHLCVGIAGWAHGKHPPAKVQLPVISILIIRFEFPQGVQKLDNAGQNSEKLESFLNGLRFEQRGKLKELPLEWRDQFFSKNPIRVRYPEITIMQ